MSRRWQVCKRWTKHASGLFDQTLFRQILIGPEGVAAAGPAEANRAKLRGEVATWPLRVSGREVEHFISYHPYARARALPWKARLHLREAVAGQPIARGGHAVSTRD